MIVKRINLCALDTGSLTLGYVGENDHTQIRINCASVFADYPSAVVSMTVKAPSGVVYPREVETDGQIVIWTITDSDTASAGNGQIQLTFTEDGTIVKTVIAVTTVRASLVGDNPPPDPITDWIDEAGEALAKLEGITASATPLPAGEAPTAEVEIVDGHYNIALGLPGADAESIIDDTAGVGDTTKVWSANKSATELSELKSEITKLPNGGYDMSNRFEREVGSSNRLVCVFNNRHIPFSVSVPSGSSYQMAIELIDENGATYYSGGWVTSYSVSRNPYGVRIRIRKSDNSNISTAEMKQFNSDFAVVLGDSVLDFTQKKHISGNENFTFVVSSGTTANRAKSSTLVTAFVPITVTMTDSSYEFALYQFDKAGNQIYGSGWVKSIHVGTKAYSVSMDLRKANNTDLSSADIRAMNDSLTISRYYVPNPVYVDTAGNDSTGDGTSALPFATFAMALAVADNIVVKPGSYTQRIRVINRDNVTICADGYIANDTDKVQVSASGQDHVLYVENCNNVSLDGIIFSGSSSHVGDVEHSRNVKIQNCQFNSSGSGSGLAFIKSDAVVTSCRADNNGNDGFNIHNCGDVVFINCTGNGNTGDGVSHHDECTGAVVGGYWTNNGKAGISTPTYGAVVQVSDAFCSGNLYGMQVYGGDDVTENTVHIKVSNVVFSGNTTGLQSDKYIVDLVNCVFANNTDDFDTISGTVNLFNEDTGNRVTVTGSPPSITGESGKRYVCGTVDSISITPPSVGIIDVVFSSGTTPTVLTVPNTVRFPAWFDATSLDASTVYEINIAYGVYGAVMAWT